MQITTQGKFGRHHTTQTKDILHSTAQRLLDTIIKHGAGIVSVNIFTMKHHLLETYINPKYQQA